MKKKNVKADETKEWMVKELYRGFNGSERY